MQLFILIRKELQIEIRAKDTILSMLLLGVSIILLFSFAFPLNKQITTSILPGLVWITIFVPVCDTDAMPITVVPVYLMNLLFQRPLRFGPTGSPVGVPLTRHFRRVDCWTQGQLKGSLRPSSLP